jgi:N-methylhydantoinase B
MTSTSSYDAITLQILWSRLIAIVDEASATLVRTSFSTIVRESNDYACVLLDVQGNSLAQSSLSIPSFISTLPLTVKQFLARYPAETLEPGDVLMTNDPWIGTGHLNDINIALPVFYKDRLVAIAASVAHAPDIGGRLRSPDNRELFEEGLRIPICKWMKGGQANEDVWDFIASNVRVPDLVLGDLKAQLAANEISARRLTELMGEQGIEDVSELAGAIQSISESDMREAIRAIPDGVYRHEVWMDGYAEPLVIRLELTVSGGEITCDYSGSSPQVDRALNVVPNYTFAYTAFPIKCVVSPDTPNHEGCFRPLSVRAPEGSLLNPRFPAAVGARASVGHYLPVAVFGALAEVVPERVQAASGSPMWCLHLSGLDQRERRFAGVFFYNGGQGASAGKDGNSCLSFPSNLSSTPTEVIEHVFPVVLERKELTPGSGGPGMQRGGLGQTLAVRIESSGPLSAAFMTERTKFPAEGLAGGRPGSLGRVLLNGSPINPKESRLLHPGDLLEISTPGGGGFGDPGMRGRQTVLADLSAGLITPEQAVKEYGLDDANAGGHDEALDVEMRRPDRSG